MVRSAATRRHMSDMTTPSVLSVPAVATVAALHVAPASRLPTRAVTQVEIVRGRGIVGDRYEGSRHRQVSVQSLDALREAENIFGAPIEPGLTRRNITVSSGVVPREPGSLIRLGDDVVLEVVRVAAPCKLLDDTIGLGAQGALRRRGGSICRVLESGVVSLGDPVRLPPSAAPTPTRVDPPRPRRLP